MKAQIAKWFAAGFGGAIGVTTSVMLAAAPGDFLYATSVDREISKGQAACFAQCAVDAQLADELGAVARACVNVVDDTWFGFAQSVKAASPAAIEKLGDVEIIGQVK